VVSSLSAGSGPLDDAGRAGRGYHQPQSLNRYAYALNEPTTLIDPTGLDAINCTIKNGCREPGGNACTIANGCREAGMNLGGFGGSCYIDGLPTFCNAAYLLLNAGSGGTTVSSVGGFLTFQVPIPPGAVQSTLIDPDTGLPIGSSAGAFYPGSFEAVTTNIPGFDFPNIGNAIRNFIRRLPPLTASIAAPVLGTPLLALGPTFAFTYIPSQNTLCGGVGLAILAPAGKAASLGALIHGHVAAAPAVASGPSTTVDLQATPFIGYQLTGNSSGILGGPTVGVPGASISATYSGCRQF
jgi:hypothetical protein